MIFVTVGTELPFDRLVRPIDEWAAANHRDDVFAQIGPSNWRPKHIDWAKFLDASECRRRIAQARVVIAHAGMGTILIARELGKPILVMPRRADLNEHRTDHQMGTVRELAARNCVVPIMDEHQLRLVLDHLEEIAVADHISAYAPAEFLEKIRGFIEEDLKAAPSGLRRGERVAMPALAKSAR